MNYFEKTTRPAWPWLVAALVAGPLAAQELLTLPEALRQANRGSLQADLADLANQGAHQGSQAILAAYQPQVHFQGGHLTVDHPVTMRSAPFELAGIQVPSIDSPTGTKSSWQTQLGADFLIYDFGKRKNALSSARAKEAAVALQGRDAVRRAQAEVAARYVAVLNLMARQKVIAQRQEALQDLLKDARQLFEQGVVARNDLLRTEVALRSVVDAARALDSGLRSASERLNLALGQPAETRHRFPEALGPPPPLPWDEATAQARAAQDNEGVQALAAKVQATAAFTRFRQRDAGPNLVARIERTYQENPYRVHTQQTAAYLGVSWKIFDGARPAQVAQAQAESAMAKRELLEARRQAGTATAQAHRAFQQAILQSASAKDNLAAALENLRIVREQYLQGYCRNADVLDAETVLAESRFSLADCQSQAYAHQAALLAILGEDLATFYASTRQES